MHKFDKWDSFLVRDHPEIGFVQSRWWSELQSDFGWESYGAIFRDGSEILGGARVLSRSFAPGLRYYYIPEGPALPSDPDDATALLSATLNFVHELRERDEDVISHLRIEPRWTDIPPLMSTWRSAGSWLEPRDTLHIDLTLSDSDLLSQMKPKGRYNVRLAQKKGVEVCQDNSARGVSDFVNMYRDMAARKRIDARSRSYIRQACESGIDAGVGTLLFASFNGVRIASALIVGFGSRATYLFGASVDEYRPVMAPYLLHFEAMRTARSEGRLAYDFYGVSPADRPQHRWADISRFKRQFGGTELQFIAAQDLIFDKSAYQTYRQRR